MAKEHKEHVEAIAAARNKLVEQRRQIIGALGEIKPGETQENMRKLVDYQAAIYALDDALADEHRMLEQRERKSPPGAVL
jgi:hypothetical protein